MDFIWNESQAEQTRAESERAMQSQMDSMMEAADSMEESADAQEAAKEALSDSLPVMITRSEERSGTDSDGDSYTYTYTWEELDGSATASVQAQVQAMTAQIAQMRAAASAMRSAASELGRMIGVSNTIFHNMFNESRTIDARAAAALTAVLGEIGRFTQKTQALLDSFSGMANPSTNANSNIFGGAGTAANAMLQGFTNAAGNLGVNAPPGIASAAAIFAKKAQSIASSAVSAAKTVALLGINIFNAVGCDPINLVTGNFYYEKEDIAVPGRYPITFKRFYNAISEIDDMLGLGWTHNYNIRLFQYENLVSITFEDGHIETFEQLKESFFNIPFESNNVLVVSEHEDYVLDLFLKDMTRYRFDETGALRCIADPNGNETLLEYESEILLKSVTTQSGSLVFEYNNDGRLTTVADHTGRVVSFEYDGVKLISTTHPNGGVFKYEYDTRDKLQKITNPMGVDSVWNRYDEKGRTITQYLADDGTARLEYNDDRMVTIVEEQNGIKTEYHRDEKYRTTKIVYAEIGRASCRERV